MSWRGREGSTSRRGRLRTRIPGPVAFALRANCGPWFLSGFLLMFVAFLLRNPDVRPDSGFGPGVMIGIVIGAAGLGRVAGTLAASTLQRITPAMAVVLALVAGAVASLLAALFYGVWTLALLGLTAGLAQSIAKFSLDATIQRDIPTKVQASAFGRSDTTCQLAWVLGGFVGIAIPLDPPRLGLTVAFVAPGRVVDVAYVPGSTAPRGRRRQRLQGVQARAQRPTSTPSRSPVQRRPLSCAEVQLVGEGAEQLGGRARGAAVGVPSVAVGLADAVEQADQVLDDRGHLVGLPRFACDWLRWTETGSSMIRTWSAWSPRRPWAIPNSTRVPGLTVVMPSGSASACR